MTSKIVVNNIESDTGVSTVTFNSNISGNLTGNVTGNVNATGLSTFSSGVVVAAGTTSAPAISPSGDNNTGIFFPAADTVAIGEGGVEVLRVDSSGRVGINTNSPTSSLSVQGTIESLSDTTSPNSISEGGQLILRAPARAGGTKYRLNIDNHWSTAGTASSVSYFRFFRENDGDGSNGLLLASIDEGGRMRLPYQPSFDAVHTSGGGSVVTTTANTEIVFNNTNHNEGSHYSTSTGRFTAPITGKYLFMMFGMNNTNTAWYDIRVNGSLRTYRHSGYSTPTGGAEWTQSSENVIISLNQGDYVSVFTGNATGGIYSGGNNHNGFSGFFIG